MDIKQVLVIRNDLNMRKGKMIAQGSHASISFLTKRFYEDNLGLGHYIKLTEVEQLWLELFKKICVYVSSNEELLEIYNSAKQAGLEVHLICDDGLTDVPPNTNTCLAIGPDYSEKIDPITGHLPLL